MMMITDDTILKNGKTIFTPNLSTSLINVDVISDIFSLKKKE